MTIHMVMFEIKWMMDGVWRTNAYDSPDQWVSVGTADEPLSVRVSNWTIPLLEFTWLLGKMEHVWFHFVGHPFTV